MPTEPNRERDSTPPAPGDLELVRGFLSLHDHAPGTTTETGPSPETIRWWLVETGLLDETDPATEDDLRWSAEVLEALHALVLENAGDRADPSAVRTIDAATASVGLAPRFGADGLVPSADGVRGAIGQILAIAFLARLDGSWARFKECASRECRAVFYDRSKNRSGKWCVMAECGNRAKVRAFRERERARS
jgi:hypothetical protein